MLVLFDHGTPKGLARALFGHTVHTFEDLSLPKEPTQREIVWTANKKQWDLITNLDIDRRDRAGLLKRQLNRARRRDRAAASDRDRKIALTDCRRRGGRDRRQARWQPPEQRGRDQHQYHRQ